MGTDSASGPRTVRSEQPLPEGEGGHRLYALTFDNAVNWTVTACVILAFLVSAVVLIAYLRSPILDMHGFRQTQTAISVYWMEKGQGLVNYQTPVAGAPWTIPFEAPVYQMSVAILDKVTPFGLDAAGRLTSWLYLVGSALTGARILGALLPRNPLAGRIFIGLLLLAPQYLFWGRTFLVETCAVFFGLVLVLGVIRYYRDGRLVWLAVAAGASLLCALAKSTSWPAFALASAMFWLAESAETRRVLWLRTAALVAVAAATLAATFAWNHFADAQKSLSPFGAALTSANLAGWNFGDLTQRMSADLWLKIVPDRMLPAALGLFWPAAAIVALFGLRGPVDRRRNALVAAALLALFLTPIMLFTNLHMVHNYYQTANALFLVAVAAVALAAAAKGGRAGSIAVLVIVPVIVVGQLIHFAAAYKPLLDQRLRESPSFTAAMAARQMVPEGRSLYVFGVDWSSEVLYYARRKGIAFAPWYDPGKIRLALSTPQAFVGDTPLGGVVDCRETMQKYGNLTPDLDAFVNQMQRSPGAKTVDTDGGCRVVALGGGGR